MRAVRDDDPIFEQAAAAAYAELVDEHLLAVENAAQNAVLTPDPIIFDIESILPADDAPGLMFGPPGSMKSWIAIALCDAIVRGVPFLGYQTRQRPAALYINLDAGKKTFRNRVRAISRAPEFDFVTLSSGDLSQPLLRAYLNRFRGGFIVIDCLSNFYIPNTQQDPNSSMRVFVDGLRALFAEYECGGLIIDHPHRPKEKGELGDYYGSIQKEAAFRSMWSVAAEAVDDPQAPRRTKLMWRKLSEGAPFAPIEIDITFGEVVTVARAAAIAGDVRASILEAKILEWAQNQTTAFTRKTISEKPLGYAKTKILQAFENLVERGQIEPTGQTRNGGPLFRYASGSSGSDPVRPTGSFSSERSGSSGSPIGDPLLSRTRSTHSDHSDHLEPIA